MAGKLDRAAVQAWLPGQRRAQEALQEERVQFLLSLTPSRSVEIYLGLAKGGVEVPQGRPIPGAPCIARGPGPTAGKPRAMNPLRAAGEVASFLEERGFRYFAIDGFVLEHWGEPRLTRAVDVTVPDPRELSDRAQKTLEAR